MCVCVCLCVSVCVYVRLSVCSSAFGYWKEAEPQAADDTDLESLLDNLTPDEYLLMETGQLPQAAARPSNRRRDDGSQRTGAGTGAAAAASDSDSGGGRSEDCVETVQTMAAQAAVLSPIAIVSAAAAEALHFRADDVRKMQGDATPPPAPAPAPPAPAPPAATEAAPPTAVDEAVAGSKFLVDGTPT